MIKSGKNKLALAIVGATALAVAGIGTAGIKNTKHNLGDTGSGNSTSATGEICVFCHTPHGASTKNGTDTVAVPLWNRNLASHAASSYTTYDQLGTSSLDGGIVDVGSVSIACLSCHDGQQAMDVMINEPGSGAKHTNFDESIGWSGTPGADTMTEASFGITYIGTDLTNDHPIGIQYGGGGSNGSNNASGQFGGTYNDPDFRPAVAKQLDNMPIWWIPTVAASSDNQIGTTASGGTVSAVYVSGASRSDGGDGTQRNKTDIQLYTRLLVSEGGGSFDRKNGTTAQAEPYVECASCHDPHSENTTFLRVDNRGSGVCLACHTK